MNNRTVRLYLAAALAFFASVAGAQETGAENAPRDTQELSVAVQKSMDPNVWIKLMNSMMSGELQGQPAIASCVECHTDEDVARYQKDFGGMLQAMNPVMQMGNPQLYGGMANGMTAMINPMTGMITPMMGMAYPMTGMMMAPMTLPAALRTDRSATPPAGFVPPSRGSRPG